MTPSPSLLELVKSHTVLRQGATLSAMAILLCVAGLWMHSLAARHRSTPAELATARSTLEKMGGEQGLEERRERLLEIRRGLERQQRAAASDTAAFNRRIDALFLELGLEIDAAGDWQPVADVVAPPAALFARYYRGRGSAEALWTALHSLETWPDGARVRSLAVSAPEGRGAAASGSRSAGEIGFTAQIAVVRRDRAGLEAAPGARPAASGGSG